MTMRKQIAPGFHPVFSNAKAVGPVRRKWFSRHVGFGVSSCYRGAGPLSGRKIVRDRNPKPAASGVPGRRNHAIHSCVLCATPSRTQLGPNALHWRREPSHGTSYRSPTNRPGWNLVGSRRPKDLKKRTSHFESVAISERHFRWFCSQPPGLVGDPP